MKPYKPLYRLTMADTATEPNYLGHLSYSGSWYIQRVASPAPGELEIRYATGKKKPFSEAWENRRELKYRKLKGEKSC